MIIQTIYQLKTYIATVIGDNFDKYGPYLQKAELWLKRELIGPDVYELLEEPNTDLIGHCANVVAHKAYLDAIPFLDLVETENGFAIVSNDNLTPASTARVQALIKATDERLSECVEDLLEYLEETAAFHDDWKSSKAFSLITDSYFSNLRQFRQYAKFEASRLEFIKYKPVINRMRKLKIEPVISAALSLEIIEELRDGDLGEENEKIIEDLRYALASFTMGDDASGDSFIARVKKYLIANYSDFPAFAESDIYLAYQVELSAAAPTDPPFMTCGI